ncbi:MAG: TRAP transporter fused permease subunit [Proteobacteria bacterium]|nr:TRAP transporter fused permease subunit [Pseudomonadota bacterium]MBU1612251.1 TRAP transporter fused permease subunit [Pseudomonadota bacterium]
MYEKLHRIEQIIFDFLAVTLVLCYTWSAIFEPAATQYHRGIYVLVTYVLVFLLYKSKTLVFRILDYALIVGSIISISYWTLNFEVINYRVGIETDLDKAIAIIGVLISIELARRVVGSVFVFIGIGMMLYGMYGNLVPDLFAHAGARFDVLCTSIFYRSDGIFGIMANVLATYILLFVLFGAFLEKCGAQRFFIDFPLAAVGHRVGGPAKVAVIASALFGSISGSAIANTVSTGTFTIPMMKKAGFKPHVAGAIEPAASIGGMFMPPIMGAGGFIMAELTGVPYSWIMLVAVFPAAMYFFSVFVMVHYEAKMYGLAGERYKYSAMQILKNEWQYTLPLMVITFFMLTGYSPGYSAIAGLAVCISLSFKGDSPRIDPTVFILMAFVVVFPWLVKGVSHTFGPETAATLKPYMSGRILLLYGAIATVFVYIRRKQTLGGLKTELGNFVAAARAGTESSLKIGATVGVIGIIIGVLTYSGLVLTFADIVIELAGGSLVLTILLIALASLVLGMGVPVTAAYLITAVVAVPALIVLGVNEIAAHMIVYWLSQDSNITPPVCIAAFAGATIAKANMWKTAFTSFKFAKFLYLGPFLFAYVPAFSLNDTPAKIAMWFAIITVIVFMYSWFMSFIWFKPLKRLFVKAPA